MKQFTRHYLMLALSCALATNPVRASKQKIENNNANTNQGWKDFVDIPEEDKKIILAELKKKNIKVASEEFMYFGDEGRLLFYPSDEKYDRDEKDGADDFSLHDKNPNNSYPARSLAPVPTSIALKLAKERGIVKSEQYYIAPINDNINNPKYFNEIREHSIEKPLKDFSFNMNKWLSQQITKKMTIYFAKNNEESISLDRVSFRFICTQKCDSSLVNLAGLISAEQDSFKEDAQSPFAIIHIQDTYDALDEYSARRDNLSLEALPQKIKEIADQYITEKWFFIVPDYFKRPNFKNIKFIKPNTEKNQTQIQPINDKHQKENQNQNADLVNYADLLINEAEETLNKKDKQNEKIDSNDVDLYYEALFSMPTKKEVTKRKRVQLEDNTQKATDASEVEVQPIKRIKQNNQSQREVTIKANLNDQKTLFMDHTDFCSLVEFKKGWISKFYVKFNKQFLSDAMCDKLFGKNNSAPITATVTLYSCTKNNKVIKLTKNITLTPKDLEPNNQKPKLQEIASSLIDELAKEDNLVYSGSQKPCMIFTVQTPALIKSSNENTITKQELFTAKVSNTSAVRTALEGFQKACVDA